MKTILISRTDAIGDVILTLPLCGYLKEQLPGCRILFLGKSYTVPVLECCEHIDQIINWDVCKAWGKQQQLDYFAGLKIDTVLHVLPNHEVARICKTLRIPERIGTRNRWFHWLTANRLLKLSRKNSDLHEAQLNIRLANLWLDTETVPLGKVPTYYGFKAKEELGEQWQSLLSSDKKHIILHPRSRGNGREWSLEQYRQLIELLSEKDYSIYISGTAEDRQILAPWLNDLPSHVQDLTGKMTLDQFIAFIAHADALVASGTGPIHMAAALGIRAVGLFPPIKPIHPGRWAPLGKQAIALTGKASCENCSQVKNCSCMEALLPEQVKAAIENK